MRRIIGGLTASTILLLLADRMPYTELTAILDAIGAVLLVWAFYIVDFRLS